jgi:putative PIN family toxin of toxin-antitoxin system
MRIVLDTNLVVRAAHPRAGLARSILLEALSDRHTLILSNALYLEIYKVMHYDRVRRQHGLDDGAILEFMEALAEVCLPVVLPPGGSAPLIAADPRDDHVLLTAIAGNANALGTNNRHFFSPEVERISELHGIRIVRDVELIALMRHE